MLYSKKRRGKQKSISIILVVLLILAIILSSILPVIVYGEEKDNLKIKGEVGFKNKYIINMNTPLILEITNEGKEFNGTVQVKVLTGDYEIKEYVIYEQNITLPQGSTKKVTMNIKPVSLQKYFTVSLVSDSKSKEVAKKIIYATPFEPYRGFVGVLSDDFESVSYLKNLKLDTARSAFIGNRLVELTEETFPENLDLFNNFEMIIINNFDTSKLSDEQLDNLKTWVLSGGVMVLGTGVNASKVLRGFDKDFINVKDNGMISINDFAQMEEIGLHALEVYAMDVADLEIENGTGILFAGNLAISSLINRSEGSIVVHHFDLGLNPIAGWQGNYYMLTELYMNVPDVIEFASQDRDSYYSYNYDYYNYSLRLFPRPNQNYLFVIAGIIIVIYIFLIGPILYIILKIKDKREYGWFIIPVASVVFSLLIILISRASILRHPLASSVGVISLGEGETRGTMEVSMGVFTPKSGENVIEILKGIKPQIGSFYYYYNSYNTDSKKEKIIGKVNIGEQDKITFYNTNSWAMNIITGKTKFDASGPVNATIYFKDSELVGVIENNLGFDLEHCILVFGNNYRYIGKIENNKSVNIDVALKYNTSNKYDVLNQIFGITFDKKDLKEKWGDIPEEELQEIIQRRHIYEESFDRYYNYNTMQYYGQNSSSYDYFKDNYVVLYGFNDEELLEGIKVNNHLVEHYKQNLFVIPLKIDSENMDYIEIPYGFIKPFITSEAGFSYDNYDDFVWITSDGAVDITFPVPSDLDVKEFQVQYSENINVEKALIYNNVTDEWEELSALPYSDNAEDYISDESMIQLKFEIQLVNDVPNARLPVPYIYLKGDK